MYYCKKMNFVLQKFYLPKLQKMKFTSTANFRHISGGVCFDYRIKYLVFESDLRQILVCKIILDGTEVSRFDWSY